MPELKDILKSINVTKDGDLIDEYNKSDYSPYKVNRCFSYYPETVMQANELNLHPELDKILQYKYLLNAVRKKNRYSPWLKYKVPEEIQLIKEYYGYSTAKAKQVLPLLSKDDLTRIKQILDKGGIRK